MSYSVGVQNIFELLEDETDDQPEVKTPQTKVDDVKVTKPRQEPVGGKPVKGAGTQRDNKPKGPADIKPEGFTEVSKNRSPANKDRPRGDRPRREGENRDNRGPRENRPRREGENRSPRPPREGGDREGGDRPRREGDNRGPRENRPPREGREPREARAPREDRPPREGREDRGPHHGVPREDRDKERYIRDHQNAAYEGKNGKRTYDRRSGTGRNPKENKKGGAGAANWGSDTDPKEELAATEATKDAEATTEETAATTEAETPISPSAEPKEPEKKEITYADFKKQREAAISNLPTLPAPRQAGEGVQDKEKDKWATEALRPKAEEKTVASGEKKEEKTTKKNTVSLDQIFTIKPREKANDREDRPRRDRERNDRERSDRPRGPKQGGKGGKGDQAKGQSGSDAAQPVISKDDAAFPSLNTKA